MSKRAWALVAVLAVGLSFPAAGSSKHFGGTLNMIAWEGYTQPQWVKPFTAAVGMHGAREVRGLLRRDGHADAFRRRQPVRHGLGFG